MLVPLSWLKNYVDITLPTPELCERLTLAGLEVGAVERVGDWWDPDFLRVGQVVNVLPHPDADRLVLVDVDYGGDEPQRVVTGAPNLAEYKGVEPLPVLKAAFARSGAMLIDAYSDKTPRPKKKLKPSKIRGIKSSGMVCSELELGLSEEHEGIILFPEDAPVGMPLRDYLGEEVIEMELTPDMARCLNMIGVAREVNALTGGALHLPDDICETDGGAHQASDYFDVRIDDPELCNRFTGHLIQNVQIGPSPKWMQDFLVRAGMRPINNIVDITNYVMLEWGQPLHAFDYDVLKKRSIELNGDTKPTIIVRRAVANEKFTTLDNIERQLDETMLMITDTAGSVAIGGVMGGLESEVTDETTTILLEAATFEGINNRRTGQKLRLTSEASHRFARSIPATLNPIAARRAADLMRQYASGSVVPGMVDVYPVPQEERLIYTTASDTNRLLGMALNLDEMADALQRLDIQVEQVDDIAPDAPADATFALHRLPNEPLLSCIAPWHRLDLRIPADLTEEVARVIGYEKVGTTLINDLLPTQRRSALLETEDHIQDILIGCGLQEIINHPLTSPESHDKLSISNAEPSAYVALSNPGVEERSVMRRSLLVGALETLGRNQRYAQRQKYFEVGRVYLPENSEGPLPQEERRLSLLMTGPRVELDFHHQIADEEMLDFFDLKGVVETLLTRLGYDLSQVAFHAQPDTETYGPRCASITLNDQPLGFMGEIHPQVRNAFGLSNTRVCVAELQIAPLVQAPWELQPMSPISNYPPVVEDLAFEVSEEVTVGMVQDSIRKAGGEVLVHLELFDIYRGDPLPAGHKSLAYRLTYQSPSRSVNEKEVTSLRKRIIKQVVRETGAKLRGG